MADVVDKETRSRMMAGIRGKNTKPELLLRRALHADGFRYRIHDPKLVGKPDLVFPMYKALIFVHGCFWHRHPGCWWNTTPSSNAVFWEGKLSQNAERDAHTVAELRDRGWRIAIVWECSFKLLSVSEVASAVKDWLTEGMESLVLPTVTRKRRLTS